MPSERREGSALGSETLLGAVDAVRFTRGAPSERRGHGGDWECPEGTESTQSTTFRVESHALAHRSSPSTTPTMFYGPAERSPRPALCSLRAGASDRDGRTLCPSA